MELFVLFCSLFCSFSNISVVVFFLFFKHVPGHGVRGRGRGGGRETRGDVADVEEPRLETTQETCRPESTGEETTAVRTLCLGICLDCCLDGFRWLYSLLSLPSLSFDLFPFDVGLQRTSVEHD